MIQAQQNGKLLKFLDSDHRLLTVSSFSGPVSDARGPIPVLTVATVGAVVSLSYDMEGVDLAGPVTVEVISPDGNHQEVTFNLADLR